MLIKCTNGSIPQKEIDVYVDQIKRNNPEKDIKAVEITLDGDFVSVKGSDVLQGILLVTSIDSTTQSMPRLWIG